MGHENSKNDLVKIFLPIKWTWGYQTITNVLFFFKQNTYKSSPIRGCISGRRKENARFAKSII